MVRHVASDEAARVGFSCAHAEWLLLDGHHREFAGELATELVPTQRLGLPCGAERRAVELQAVRTRRDGSVCAGDHQPGMADRLLHVLPAADDTAVLRVIE